MQRTSDLQITEIFCWKGEELRNILNDIDTPLRLNFGSMIEKCKIKVMNVVGMWQPARRISI